MSARAAWRPESLNFTVAYRYTAGKADRLASGLLIYGNVLTGLWLIAAPWLLPGATTGSIANDVAVGVVLIALSIPHGSVRQRYGDWVRWTQ